MTSDAEKELNRIERELDAKEQHWDLAISLHPREFASIPIPSTHWDVYLHNYADKSAFE